MLRAKGKFCKHFCIFGFEGFALVAALLSLLPVHAQKQNINSRIVGGTTTTVSSFPHMVHLIFDGAPLCGGSLLSSTWIVTAAHCVNHHGTEPNRFQIRGGTSFLTGTAGVTRPVAKIIINSGYNTKTLDKDIAMLKLAAPMTGPNIKPIKIAAATVPNGATVTVNGWGYTKQGAGVPSNQLRTVQLKKISQAACRKRYPKLTVNMICADEPGKGKCSGDSGGGMLYKSALVALVSHGAGCGNKNAPGVYTNLLQLKPFINDVMRNN